MKKYLSLLLLCLFSSAAFAGYWIRANDGYIPDRAWAIGSDQNGQTLYLCQAQNGNSVSPGKLRNDFNGCHISYGGQELVKPVYRAYIGRHHGYWRFAENGDIPQNAWRVGHDSNGASLYLCRVDYQGVQIGKVRPGIGGCNIPFGGREIVKNRYLVFVQRTW